MNRSSENSSLQYTLIEEAIAYLRANHRQQPGLSALAAHLGLSESHLQRLFSRWAGISPKRFIQFQNVEYAKRKMAETSDLLSLSLLSGLSGPGRLHDLFVTMEAMSPGEFKQAAKGMNIHYGTANSPFGPALVARTRRGICHLSFTKDLDQERAIERLVDHFSSAHLVHDPTGSEELLRQVFNPILGKTNGRLGLWVSGSNFQIQVWRALLRIPNAGLLNYQQLASFIGLPKAYRSVASAIAKNPIAYLIPCHRVLRKTGEFGAYHWGSNRKTAIHLWEAGRAGQGPKQE